MSLTGFIIGFVTRKSARRFEQATSNPADPSLSCNAGGGRTDGNTVWYVWTPAEVEAVLGTHPDIAEIAIVPRPDPVMGEIGVAVVVARPGSGTPTLDDLRSYAGARLASYKLPEAVRVVDVLPRNGTDKVDLDLLRGAVGATTVRLASEAERHGAKPAAEPKKEAAAPETVASAKEEAPKAAAAEDDQAKAEAADHPKGLVDGVFAAAEEEAEVVCPACESDKIFRVLSTFAVGCGGSGKHAIPSSGLPGGGGCGSGGFS